MAAEKYAELEALGEERPRCECHGEAKKWKCREGRTPGGYWTCAEKTRRSRRRWGVKNKEKVRETNLLWRQQNPEYRAMKYAELRRDQAALDVQLGRARDWKRLNK